MIFQWGTHDVPMELPSETWEDSISPHTQIQCHPDCDNVVPAGFSFLILGNQSISGFISTGRYSPSILLHLFPRKSLMKSGKGLQGLYFAIVSIFYRSNQIFEGGRGKNYSPNLGG